mmetsp:Transcript_83363/g.258893  ORF Transcript_83363/g.258893 Transcript_83363/m.258893 type:complete len:398 (-) Transcript_83363:72-1265(-)
MLPSTRGASIALTSNCAAVTPFDIEVHQDVLHEHPPGRTEALLAPLLLQRLASSPAELDGLAARRPKAAAAVVAALREALEPFPQLQGPLGSLDGVSQAQHFEGLGAALEGLLRAALQLPEEQQRDVVSVLHAVVVERLLQLPSEEAAAAPAVGAPQGVACDGCDATPIAEHTFDHHEAVACSAAEGCSGGWPQGPWSGWGHHAWGKGWDHHGPAKGWGKGQGKGWGGHHAWAKGRGSHHGWAKGWGRHAWGPKGWGLKGWSKSWAKGWPQAGLGTDAGCADSSSDSSDSSEDPGRGPRAGRAPRSKSEPRPGTRDWKRARREACKQAWPAAKASKAAEGGAAPQPAAEAGALAPAPPAQEELLAALQAMGFHDRELNAQLLAAHGGDVEAALQQLL